MTEVAAISKIFQEKKQLVISLLASHAYELGHEFSTT